MIRTAIRWVRARVASVRATITSFLYPFSSASQTAEPSSTPIECKKEPICGMYRVRAGSPFGQQPSVICGRPAPDYFLRADSKSGPTETPVCDACKDRLVGRSDSFRRIDIVDRRVPVRDDDDGPQVLARVGLRMVGSSKK